MKLIKYFNGIKVKFLRNEISILAKDRKIISNFQSYRLSFLEVLNRLTNSSDQKRYYSSITTNVVESERADQLGHKGFKDLGLNENLVNTLKIDFNIHEPTETQRVLINSILNKRDIILRSVTGTGKTFATMLTLMNQAIYGSHFGNDRNIYYIFIVPSRELAIQILNWSQKLYSELKFNDDIQKIPFDYIMQAVYKDERSVKLQESLLSDKTPKILIGTSNRILELVNKELLDLKSLKLVVLDEVDHLLRLPSRHAPQKKIWIRETHPKPATLLLQKIFEGNVKREINLLVMSATINRGIRHYLKQQGWMKTPVYIDGSASGANLTPKALEHMCIVVGPTRVYNLDTNPESFNLSQPNFNNELDDLNGSKIPLVPGEEDLKEDDPRLLEAVALSAHADSVKLGLLFVPNTIKLEAAISSLKSMGINAQRLESLFSPKSNDINSTPILNEDSSDFNEEVTSRPRLYLSNYFGARGMDIPDITHVFIIGYPGSVQDYQHICGRVGRMGSKHDINQGRIISLIPQGGRHQHKMRAMFKLLGVETYMFPHIED